MMVLAAGSAFAWETPEVYENACSSGCTPKMEEIYNEFLSTPNALTYYPGMYSGECRHLSNMYDPYTTHYAGMLFDKDDRGAFMTGTLQFFGDSNRTDKWSYEEAKRNFMPNYKGGGRLVMNPTSTTTFYLDQNGRPNIVYWARQNLITKDILFLVYMRDMTTGFCKLKLNTNGLP